MDSSIARAQELLKNYRPSRELLEKLKSLQIGAIVGPAGSGKDTLREALIQAHPETYQRLLSTTSRPRRPYEKDGEEYYFSTAETMLAGIEAGEYLQAATPHDLQISGIHQDMLLHVDDAKISLPIIVVDTETEIRRLAPQMKSVFLIPPSVEILKERINIDRALSVNEITRRLSSAVYEITCALQRPHYYFIETATVDGAVHEADMFFRMGQRSDVTNFQARRTAQVILRKLQS